MTLDTHATVFEYFLGCLPNQTHGFRAVPTGIVWAGEASHGLRYGCVRSEQSVRGATDALKRWVSLTLREFPPSYIGEDCMRWTGPPRALLGLTWADCMRWTGSLSAGLLSRFERAVYNPPSNRVGFTVFFWFDASHVSRGSRNFCARLRLDLEYLVARGDLAADPEVDSFCQIVNYCPIDSL